MAYTFDPIFAADPNNTQVVASNAAILIFDPADSGASPTTITDATGSPLANPITVNKNGFGPAFQHATLDRLGWHGGGFTGYFTSYEGMKAVASAAAADASAAQTAAEAASVDAAAAAATAEAAAVAPTDEAVDAALNSTFVRSTDANAALTDGQILFVIEPSWTPNNLANVKMWFDAQQQTAANGALIGQVNDYSGQGRHAIQAVDGNKPVFSTSGINGKSAFVYGGTKRASVPTFTAITGPITIIGVGIATTPTVNAEYMVDSTGGIALFRSATTGNLGGARGTTLAGSAVSNGPHVFIEELGVGANASHLYKDGVLDATGTTTDTIGMTSLVMGARLDLTRFWQGNIGEVIIVNGILTATEKTNLAAYVAAKWGI